MNRFKKIHLHNEQIVQEPVNCKKLNKMWTSYRNLMKNYSRTNESFHKWRWIIRERLELSKSYVFKQIFDFKIELWISSYWESIK